MSRLFAYVGNDQDRVKCALYPARSLLVADGAAAGTFDAWGLGFYQGGEVLLQRRPKPPLEPVDFYTLTRDLRTDVIVGETRTWLTNHENIRDIPPPGSRIPLGRPVCTIFANGGDGLTCHDALVQCADRVYAQLAAWRT